MYYKAPFGYLLLSGVFFFIDRFFKWQALNVWTKPIQVTDFLGWEPFWNYGIAFGIVLPTYLVLSFSTIIIGIVSYIFYQHFRLHNRAVRLVQGIGLIMILTGAISNLIDRIIYQYTIDYFRIFTSVINIADCLIVSGFMLLYFLTLKQIKPNVN